MRKYNLPIFIPHRGCPHDCIFCNQRKITGVNTEVTPNHVRNLIESFLETVDTKNSSIEIAFFGGSFTGLDMDLQEEFLKTANEFSSVIDGIRLSTRPDYINNEIINLLQKYNVTTVELGVQSTNDIVLNMNNRGHNFRDVECAAKLIKEAGIKLGLQFMLGMYGSDPEKDLQTIEDIVMLEPACVRIYPVITLKGTALEKLYLNGEYTPYSLSRAAELAKIAVLKCRRQNIEVIRMGLHASEELDEGTTVVAGPYHPAFGEIVESLIYRDKIEEEVRNKNLSNTEFTFVCPKGDISKAVGHKRMNKDYFYKKYKVKLIVKEH